jgi:F0F1-type ATP synthase membrane subunit c/vacuolar-type H+-ATPase subunit K
MKMMAAQASGTAAQRKQVMNIIWVAMVAAVGIYWYVHIIAGRKEPDSTVGLMILILAVISVGECIGGWIFNHVTLADITQKLNRAQLGGSPIDADGTLEQRLQSTAIICLAMFEAVVVYGLVGSFVGSPYPNTFEGFAVVGLLNLVMYRIKAYPTIFSILEQLEKIRRVR